MPTNLNALIRYKQIDICLRNPYMDSSINMLQEYCTNALGESRGIYRLISERTIRDDIRVMRSDILGFNAPIELINGKYVYSDKDYSIFSIPVTEIKLLKEILKLLREEKKNIVSKDINSLLFQISEIVGEPLPFIKTSIPKLSGSIGTGEKINLCQFEKKPWAKKKESSSNETTEKTPIKRKRKRIKFTPQINKIVLTEKPKEAEVQKSIQSVIAWEDILKILSNS